MSEASLVNRDNSITKIVQECKDNLLSVIQWNLSRFDNRNRRRDSDESHIDDCFYAWRVVAFELAIENESE